MISPCAFLCVYFIIIVLKFSLNPVKNSPVDDEASLPSDDEEEGDNLSEAAASSQGLYN